MTDSASDAFHTVELSDPALERDGLRIATVRSRALGCRTDVSFWIPPGAKSVSTLLILLHGVYGSHWVWAWKGAAHQTAARLVRTGEIGPLIIAMPSDGLVNDGSGYLSWPGGPDVERFIIEEVPRLARLAAPVLHSDCKVAIAGLSMGGYGALRLGAKYADCFSAISAHSAITTIADFESFVQEPLHVYEACAPAPELEAAYWLKQNRSRLPPLRFDCGTDDALLESNRRLHNKLEQAGVPHQYQEFKGGHTWAYWTEHLVDTLLHVDRHSRGSTDA